MKPTTGITSLLERANSEIEVLTPQEVDGRIANEGTLLVDLRDVRELKRDGKIPESVHVPRGMLEFWIDPASPYYKEFFTGASEIIFHCSKGWRSALATKTAQDMGFDNVKHMAGGFGRWVEDVGRVEEK
jgi:rhodanese-related sulfurtransferase